MVFAVVLLLVCLTYGSSARFQDTDIQSGDLPKTAIDYILCRHCGRDISPLTSLISVNSPAALENRVSQLFGLKDVHVQTVKNSLDLQFEIITLSKTLCVGKGNVSHLHFILNITCILIKEDGTLVFASIYVMGNIGQFTCYPI